MKYTPEEALKNMLGAFDTPLTRLRMGKSWTDFHEEAVKSARDAVNGGAPLFTNITQHITARVFVGCSDKRPKEVLPHLDGVTHPRDFKPANTDVFSNNACFVRNYLAENVIVVSSSGRTAPLTAHPNWNKWKDEFDSGEFWSMVGEEWVDKL